MLWGRFRFVFLSAAPLVIAGRETCARALEDFMHSILFSQKHAYLTTLAKQREWLRGFGITPARYEMLFVISEINKWLRAEHFVYQSDVRRQLGVTAATVSKMLAALEKLGFVTRKRSVADERQVIVDLTRKARDLLKWVRKRLIEPGLIWLTLFTVFHKSHDALGSFDSNLYRVRTGFKDKATFLYPWFQPRRRRRSR